MVIYSWPRVKYQNFEKNQNFEFFLEFYIDPGGPGAIREGPEPIPELKNMKKIRFFKQN